MAKLKITTKTCPLCGYIYKRMKKYEMVNVEIDPLFDFFYEPKFISELTDLGIPEPVKPTKLVEKCTEDKVIQGDEDFKYVYHETDPMNEYYGGDPIYQDCIGMFCPKCGIFLNDNTCTKYEEEEI